MDEALAAQRSDQFFLLALAAFLGLRSGPGKTKQNHRGSGLSDRALRSSGERSTVSRSLKHLCSATSDVDLTIETAMESLSLLVR